MTVPVQTAPQNNIVFKYKSLSNTKVSLMKPKHALDRNINSKPKFKLHRKLDTTRNLQLTEHKKKAFSKPACSITLKKTSDLRWNVASNSASTSASTSGVNTNSTIGVSKPEMINPMQVDAAKYMKSHSRGRKRGEDKRKGKAKGNGKGAGGRTGRGCKNNGSEAGSNGSTGGDGDGEGNGGDGSDEEDRGDIEEEEEEEEEEEQDEEEDDEEEENEDEDKGSMYSVEDSSNDTNGRSEFDNPNSWIPAGLLDMKRPSMVVEKSLAPADPGTPVTLDGVIWQETLSGVLVVNVRWRNKVYCGSLIDCSRHDWATPRFQDPEEETNGKINNSKGGAKCKRQRSVSGSSVSSVLPSLHTSPAGKDSVRHKLRGKKRFSNNTPTKVVNAKLANAKRKLAKTANSEPSEDEGIRPGKRTCTMKPTPSPTASSPTLIECPEPNCGKKYKHINGLRYHQAHAHLEPSSPNANSEDRSGSTSPTPSEEFKEPETKIKTGKTPKPITRTVTQSRSSSPSSAVSTPSPTAETIDKTDLNESLSKSNKIKIDKAKVSRSPSPADDDDDDDEKDPTWMPSAKPVKTLTGKEEKALGSPKVNTEIVSSVEEKVQSIEKISNKGEKVDDKDTSAKDMLKTSLVKNSTEVATKVKTTESRESKTANVISKDIVIKKEPVEEKSKQSIKENTSGKSSVPHVKFIKKEKNLDVDNNMPKLLPIKSEKIDKKYSNSPFAFGVKKETETSNPRSQSDGTNKSNSPIKTDSKTPFRSITDRDYRQGAYLMTSSDNRTRPEFGFCVAKLGLDSSPAQKDSGKKSPANISSVIVSGDHPVIVPSPRLSTAGNSVITSGSAVRHSVADLTSGGASHSKTSKERQTSKSPFTLTSVASSNNNEKRNDGIGARSVKEQEIDRGSWENEPHVRGNVLRKDNNSVPSNTLNAVVPVSSIPSLIPTAGVHSSGAKEDLAKSGGVTATSMQSLLSYVHPLQTSSSVNPKGLPSNSFTETTAKSESAFSFSANKSEQFHAGSRNASPFSQSREGPNSGRTTFSSVSTWIPEAHYPEKNKAAENSGSLAPKMDRKVATVAPSVESDQKFKSKTVISEGNSKLRMHSPETGNSFNPSLSGKDSTERFSKKSSRVSSPHSVSSESGVSKQSSSLSSKSSRPIAPALPVGVAHPYYQLHGPSSSASSSSPGQSEALFTSGGSSYLVSSNDKKQKPKKIKVEKTQDIPIGEVSPVTMPTGDPKSGSIPLVTSPVSPATDPPFSDIKEPKQDLSSSNKPSSLSYNKERESRNEKPISDKRETTREKDEELQEGTQLDKEPLPPRLREDPVHRQNISHLASPQDQLTIDQLRQLQLRQQLHILQYQGNMSIDMFNHVNQMALIQGIPLDPRIPLSAQMPYLTPEQQHAFMKQFDQQALAEKKEEKIRHRSESPQERQGSSTNTSRIRHRSESPQEHQGSSTNTSTDREDSSQFTQEKKESSKPFELIDRPEKHKHRSPLSDARPEKLPRLEKTSELESKRGIVGESKRLDGYKPDKDPKSITGETKSKDQLKKKLELSWQRHQEEYLQKQSLQQKLSMYRQLESDYNQKQQECGGVPKRYKERIDDKGVSANKTDEPKQTKTENRSRNEEHQNPSKREHSHDQSSSQHSSEHHKSLQEEHKSRSESSQSPQKSLARDGPHSHQSSSGSGLTQGQLQAYMQAQSLQPNHLLTQLNFGHGGAPLPGAVPLNYPHSVLMASPYSLHGGFPMNSSVITSTAASSSTSSASSPSDGHLHSRSDKSSPGKSNYYSSSIKSHEHAEAFAKQRELEKYQLAYYHSKEDSGHLGPKPGPNSYYSGRELDPRGMPGHVRHHRGDPGLLIHAEQGMKQAAEKMPYPMGYPMLYPMMGPPPEALYGRIPSSSPGSSSRSYRD